MPYRSIPISYLCIACLFCLVAPSLANPYFTAPAGGTVIFPGRTYDVRWNNNDVDCDKHYYTVDATTGQYRGDLDGLDEDVTSVKVAIPSDWAHARGLGSIKFELHQKKTGGWWIFGQQCPGGVISSGVFQVAQAPLAPVISQTQPQPGKPGVKTGTIIFHISSIDERHNPISGFLFTLHTTTGVLSFNHPGEKSASGYTVTLANIAKSQFVSGTVAGVNAAGTGFTSDFSVPFGTVPSAPSKLQAFHVSFANATFKWHIEDDGGSEITGHVVTVQEEGAPAVVHQAGPETTLTLYNLTVGANITVSIAAVNAQGPGAAAPADLSTLPYLCHTTGCSSPGGTCAEPCGPAPGTCTCHCSEGWGTAVDDVSCSDMSHWVVEQLFQAQVSAWSGNTSAAVDRLAHITLDVFPRYLPPAAAAPVTINGTQTAVPLANLTVPQVVDSGAADGVYSRSVQGLVMEAFRAGGNLADGMSLTGLSSNFVYPRTWASYETLLENWEAELSTLQGSLDTLAAEGFQLASSRSTVQASLSAAQQSQAAIQLNLNSASAALQGLAGERQKLQEELLATLIPISGEMSAVVAALHQRVIDLQQAIQDQIDDDKKHAVWNMVKDTATILGPLVLAACTGGASMAVEGEDAMKTVGGAVLGCAGTKIAAAFGKGPIDPAIADLQKKIAVNQTRDKGWDTYNFTGWGSTAERLGKKVPKPDVKADASALCDIYDQVKSWRNGFADDPVVQADKAEIAAVDGDLGKVEQFMGFINNLRSLELVTFNSSIATLPAVLPAMYILQEDFSSADRAFPQAFRAELAKEAGVAGQAFVDTAARHLTTLTKYVGILQAWTQEAQGVQTLQMQLAAAAAKTRSALQLLERQRHANATVQGAAEALQQQQLLVWSQAQLDLHRVQRQVDAFVSFSVGTASPLPALRTSVQPNLLSLQNSIAHINEVEAAVQDADTNQRSRCWVKWEARRAEVSASSPLGLLFEDLEVGRSATFVLPLPDQSSYYAVQYDQVMAYIQTSGTADQSGGMTYVQVNDLGTNYVHDENRVKHTYTMLQQKRHFSYGADQCAKSSQVVDSSYMLNSPAGFWEVGYATNAGRPLVNITGLSLFFRVYYKEYDIVGGAGHVAGFWGHTGDQQASCMSREVRIDPYCAAPAASPLLSLAALGEAQTPLPPSATMEPQGGCAADPETGGCSFHGRCNLITGRCECDDHYTSVDCSVEMPVVSGTCRVDPATDVAGTFGPVYTAAAGTRDTGVPATEPLLTCPSLVAAAAPPGLTAPSSATFLIRQKSGGYVVVRGGGGSSADDSGSSSRGDLDSDASGEHGKTPIIVIVAVMAALGVIAVVAFAVLSRRGAPKAAIRVPIEAAMTGNPMASQLGTNPMFTAV